MAKYGISLNAGFYDALTQIGKDLNAANNWTCFGFVADSEKTINTLSINVYAIAGTQANLKATVSIYSDTNGYPGTLIQASNELTNQAAGVWTFTGLSTAMTFGTRYWFVVKNTAVAPTVDYFSVIYGTPNSVHLAGSAATYGWSATNSTTGGASWTANAAGASGFVIGFSDGSYAGTPWYTATNSTFKIYGAREEGFSFTTPAGAYLKIRAVWFATYKYGSPSGASYVKIKYGATTATSNQIPAANHVYNYMPYIFDSPVIIPQNTSVTITVCDSVADNASNYYGLQYSTLPNLSNQRGLVPFSWFYVSTTDGSTYTTDNTKVTISCGFSLDTDGEFSAPTFPAEANTVQGTPVYGFNGEYTPEYTPPAGGGGGGGNGLIIC